jgi:hypothetical protein
MKDFILDHVKTLPTIARNAGQKTCQYGYRNIRFSIDETRRIDAVCDSYHIRLGRSAFYLAAIIRSFHDAVAAEDTTHNYWVPVPQDRRRKGVLGPVFANQVSSLYYSITQEHIGSMAEVVQTLSASMMDQMRARLPESNKVMMDSMVYAPLWLYRYLIKSPTKGRLASFFFSDTGNSLEGLTAFMGHPLVEAVHYPPPSMMPGWTCIFMRVQDQQQVVVSFPNATSEDASLINKFEARLRKELLGTQ